MLKHVSRLLISFVILNCGVAIAHAEIVDRIVAVVNRKVITEFDVQQMQQTLQQQGNAPDRTAIVNFLIEQELILQEAESKGILITDTDLNAMLDDIKRQNNFITDEQLKDALAREGKTWSDFLDEIRRQVKLGRVVAQEVRAKVDVSDEEMEAYYQANREQFATIKEAEGVQVRQIFLAIPENAGESQIQQIQANAQQLVQQLRTGADFAELAKMHSDHASANAGGELGTFKPGELAAPFDIAFTLQNREITDPIRSERGFHIITVQKSDPGTSIRIIFY